MDSEQGGTAVTPETVRRRQEAKAKPARRPGGLAIGETHAYEDGLKVRVDRLGLLPHEPPKTIFDEDKQYVSAEAIRFEVTVTNEGEATASLSDLAIGVRAGKDGWPGDETWSGTRVLRGKLLPGASATGTYTYRVLAGTAGEVDVSVTRGHYSSDEKTQQIWTGAAGQGLYSEAEPGKGRLTQAQRDDLLAEAMRELDAMTGLDPVKRRVRILAAQARMSAVRARHGLPASSAARHLVFSGPPGTGKTAVARLLGKILAGTGVLEKGHLVEVHRADLIGEHLGHTGAKTNKLIDSALDGVLFVDEAYGLHGGYSGNADAFGDEALQVLLKRAEDDRHRLVVILAGYGREMRRLLAANPGLASRFATRVNFPSYDSAELMSIARGMLTASADTTDAGADEELRGICALVEANQWQDALGNGRFIRTLAENARALRDLRLADRYDKADPPDGELTELTATDLKSAFADIQEGHALGPASAA